jgi:hypothetical protein
MPADNSRLKDLLMARLLSPTLCLSALLVAFPLATPAIAKDGDVKRAGSCTGSSSAKIKLGVRDGGIETEFEVDQNRNGVKWTVTFTQNGKRVVSTTALTAAPSGSFSVKRRLSNGAGTDAITARAVSPSGEVCTANASI